MGVINHAWRWVATFFGTLLAGAEVALNAAHAAGGGSWMQLPVIVTALVTAAGAAALPIAERAWGQGDRIKALALTFVFFPLVLMLSFTSGLQRTSSTQDARLANLTASAKKDKISNIAFESALKAKKRECRGRRNGTTACKRAEKAFLRVSGMAVSNITGTVQGMEDGAVRRIADALAFMGVETSTVRQWLPFVMPFALLTGAFLLIAIGFSPGKREPEKAPAPVDEPLPTTAAPLSRTEEEARQWLIRKIMIAGRSLTGYTLRELSRESRVPHSTLAIWVRRWEEAGHVEIVRNGRQTTYRLPRMREVVGRGV